MWVVVDLLAAAQSVEAELTVSERRLPRVRKLGGDGVKPKTYAWFLVTSRIGVMRPNGKIDVAKSKLCSVRIVDEFVLCKLTQTFFRISEASIADRLKHVRSLSCLGDPLLCCT